MGLIVFVRLPGGVESKQLNDNTRGDGGTEIETETVTPAKKKKKKKR